MTRVVWLLVGGSAVGVVLATIVSTLYWGFAFRRPVVPEVWRATSVQSVTPLRAVRTGDRCTFEVAHGSDLRRELVDLRPYVSDFPQVRPLVELDDRGLLPAHVGVAPWLEPAALYQSVVDAGILVRGETGYDQAGCNEGYAVELELPGTGPRLLLTTAGPEVSNDHRPYYELLLRREGTRFVAERKRVTFFDVAGMEGAEWPVLHALFAVLSLLVGGVLWGVLTTARDLVSEFARRRPTRS